MTYVRIGFQNPKNQKVKQCSFSLLAITKELFEKDVRRIVFATNQVDTVYDIPDISVQYMLLSGTLTYKKRIFWFIGYKKKQQFFRIIDMHNTNERTIVVGDESDKEITIDDIHYLYTTLKKQHKE